MPLSSRILLHSGFPLDVMLSTCGVRPRKWELRGQAKIVERLCGKSSISCSNYLLYRVTRCGHLMQMADAFSCAANGHKIFIVLMSLHNVGLSVSRVEKKTKQALCIIHTTVWSRCLVLVFILKIPCRSTSAVFYILA